MPGITFDGTAPTMEGTWFNPKTGDVIKIRDTFFENNNYVARTTDGRMLNYNQLQGYIRDDTKSTQKQQPAKPTPVQNTAKPMIGNLPIDPDSMLTEEDRKILEGISTADDKLKENAEACQEVQNGMAKMLNGASAYLDQRGQELTLADQIIDRAMKNKEMPVLQVSVNWNAPINELKTLEEMMGITHNDIVRWIMRSLEGRDLTVDLKDSIRDYISMLLGDEEPEAEQTDDEPKPVVPKKKVPMKKARK